MTTPKPVPYGRTPSGVEITEEFLEQAAAEAEAGWDIEELRRRAVPPMGHELGAGNRHGASTERTTSPSMPTKSSALTV